MSEYYYRVAELVTNPNCHTDMTVVIEHEITGDKEDIRRNDYLSTADFLDAVYEKTGDSRFNPTSCSRRLMEDLGE